MSRHFIYHAAWNSGGRWHLAENVETEYIEPESKFYVSDIIDWDQPTFGIDRGTGEYWPKVHVPANDLYYPITGHVEADISMPGYIKAKGTPVCNQVGEVTTANIRNINFSRSLKAKKNIGKRISINGGVNTPLMLEKAHPNMMPPEPLCEFCRKAWERLNAAAD